MSNMERVSSTLLLRGRSFAKLLVLVVLAFAIIPIGGSPRIALQRHDHANTLPTTSPALVLTTETELTDTGIAISSSSEPEPSAVLLSVPSAPQNVAATEYGPLLYNITWVAPSDDGGSSIQYYSVYTTDRYGNSPTLYANTTNTWTTYSWAPPVYFIVTATNAIGEGAQSNMLVIPATPEKPSALCGAGGYDAVFLYWQAPVSDGGANITKYNIYRSLGGPFSYLTSTNETRYIDHDFSGTEYYLYRVTAVNSAGDGSYAETDAPPAGNAGEPAPANVTADNSAGFIQLSWDPVSGTDVWQYRVYRSTVSGEGYVLVGATNATTFQDPTTLQENQAYYYVVTAVNKCTESKFSTEIVTGLPTTPSPPADIIATSWTDVVSLTWNETPFDGYSQVQQYNVYRSDTSGGPYALLGSTSNLWFNDTNVQFNQTYYYVITSVNDLGESQYSHEVRGGLLTVPDAPVDVSLFADPIMGVEVWWRAPAYDGGTQILYYNGYRSVQEDSNYVFLTSNSQTLSNSWYMAAGGSVEPGKTYWYYVTAVSALGESADSVHMNVTVPFQLYAPVAPANVSAVVDNNSVYLSWFAPTEDGGSPITEYRVYRSDDSRLTYDYIGSANGTDLFFIDTTVQTEKTYWYIVTAVNKVGESAQSSPVEVFVELETFPPNPPFDLYAIVSEGLIKLYWSAPFDGGSPITGYKIFRANSAGGSYEFIGWSEYPAYMDYDITAGQTYYYVVVAVNEVGSSDYSAELSVSVPAQTDTSTTSSTTNSTTSSTSKLLGPTSAILGDISMLNGILGLVLVAGIIKRRRMITR